jgi:hypothetical protein
VYGSLASISPHVSFNVSGDDQRPGEGRPKMCPCRCEKEPLLVITPLLCRKDENSFMIDNSSN